MKRLACFLPLLFAACGPSQPDEIRTPTPPQPRQAIITQARTVSDASGAVERSNGALRRQVDTLRNATSEATSDAARAKAEAERLALQKTASEAELTGLWQMLETVEARNLFLEGEALELDSQVAKQAELIEALTVEAETLLLEAVDKDNEVNMMRRQAEDMRTSLAMAEKSLKEWKKEASDQKAAAASARTYRNIGIFVSIGIFIIIALTIWIKIARPL